VIADRAKLRMSFCTITCSLRLKDEALSSPASLSFLLPCPARWQALHDAFPFQGRYHYRVLVHEAELTGARSAHSKSQVWLDLQEENTAIIPYFRAGEVVQLQALCLDDEDDDAMDDDLVYSEYLSDVGEIIPAQRPQRFAVDSSSANDHAETNAFMKKLKARVKSGMKTLTREAQEMSSSSNITLKSVSQGATTVWNTLKASLGVTAPNSSILSDTAEENLSHLSEDLASSFTDSNPDHMTALRELWTGIFPNDAAFMRVSAKWKEAGFQTHDPVADLKTSGLLAVRAMAYMMKIHPLRSQDMLQRNKENTKLKYPFAIVGVNITLLLAEVLNLRDQKYLSAQANYWETFESPAAFFEIFSMVFVHIDIEWTSTKASRSDFAKIIGQAKLLVGTVLGKAPRSLSHFRSIAAEVGMHLESS
jgi:hypothetical protein